MTLAQQLRHGLMVGVVDYTLRVVGQVNDEVIVEVRPLASEPRTFRAVIKDDRIRMEPPR